MTQIPVPRPTEWDGEIRNAYFLGQAVNLYGDMYNDKKGRFKDGEDIHTSHVKEVWFDDASRTSGIAKTRNSVYKFTLFTDKETPPSKVPDDIKVYFS